MSTGYQIYDQYGTCFLTFTIVDWVDIFSRRIYRDVIIDSLKHCIAEKELCLYSFVIMSNHIHIIARSGNGKLSDTIRDLKKFTARKIIEKIKEEPESRRECLLHLFAWNASLHARNEHHQVWTHENHAVEINSASFFDPKLDYIHENPVRAGLVEKAEDYVYSSAKVLMENREIHFKLCDRYE